MFMEMSTRLEDTVKNIFIPHGWRISTDWSSNFTLGVYDSLVLCIVFFSHLKVLYVRVHPSYAEARCKLF
jgi:hypothetical protein